MPHPGLCGWGGPAGGAAGGDPGSREQPYEAESDTLSPREERSPFVPEGSADAVSNWAW